MDLESLRAALPTRAWRTKQRALGLGLKRGRLWGDVGTHPVPPSTPCNPHVPPEPKDGAPHPLRAVPKLRETDAALPKPLAFPPSRFFHSNCIILHNHQQCTRFPISPHSCQCSLFPVFIYLFICRTAAECRTSLTGVRTHTPCSESAVLINHWRPGKSSLFVFKITIQWV